MPLYAHFGSVYKKENIVCFRGTRRTASRHRFRSIIPTTSCSRLGAGSGGKQRTRSHDTETTGRGFAFPRAAGARNRHRSVFRVQEVQGRVRRRGAAADPPTPVLQRQPGQPGRVQDRTDRLRLQTVRRRTLQDATGTEATLRQREPSEIREGEFCVAAAIRIATQSRNGGRRESDNPVGGQGRTRDGSGSI